MAQGGEPKHFKESFRRDISEGRPRLGRAEAPVDEAMTLQRADDVAADLPSGKPRDLRPRCWLQVSDNCHGQELGRRQFGKTRVAQAPAVRRSDGVGEAWL